VPAYLAGLDACLVPYRQSTWTAGIFPAKLYEYLAAGRPVVATSLPALTACDEVVAVAADVDGFLAACRQAVTESDPERASRRRAVAAAHSLDARCRILDGLLDALAA
jgi:glycosyltransferase involved in cell wall biosynthesis